VHFVIGEGEWIVNRVKILTIGLGILAYVFALPGFAQVQGSSKQELVPSVSSSSSSEKLETAVGVSTGFSEEIKCLSTGQGKITLPNLVSETGKTSQTSQSVTLTCSSPKSMTMRLVPKDDSMVSNPRTETIAGGKYVYGLAVRNAIIDGDAVILVNDSTNRADDYLVASGASTYTFRKSNGASISGKKLSFDLMVELRVGDSNVGQLPIDGRFSLEFR
jgi:hypothetical protein